jgi:hypothetical protein
VSSKSDTYAIFRYIQFLCVTNAGVRWVACAFDVVRKQLTTFDASPTPASSDSGWNRNKQIVKSLFRGFETCILHFFNDWDPDFEEWTFVFVRCGKDNSADIKNAK